MPHIHTKPGQHDHTASAFIIRLDQPEPALMLHRHKILKKYLQFGGHIELNETPWQAISRELLEESGYKLSQLKILQPKHSLKITTGSIVHPLPACYLTHAFSDDHFHTDVDYAFTATEPPSRAPAKGESADIILVNKAELIALPSAEIPENVREIGLYIFMTVLQEWEPVETSVFKL